MGATLKGLRINFNIAHPSNRYAATLGWRPTASQFQFTNFLLRKEIRARLDTSASIGNNSAFNQPGIFLAYRPNEKEGFF
jgi:hypothetical protein